MLNRLKVVDMDGGSTYSTIVLMDFRTDGARFVKKIMKQWVAWAIGSTCTL